MYHEPNGANARASIVPPEQTLQHSKLTLSPWQSTHTVAESESPPLGRNEAVAPSHPKPAAQPALQLKVLTLVFKLLTLRPLLRFALTPRASAQCPRLGPDRMPQIPGAWVYLWSKVCQQGSSCCVKPLVMRLRYFRIPNHQWVWIREVARSGEWHRYGCNWW